MLSYDSTGMPYTLQLRTRRLRPSATGSVMTGIEAYPPPKRMTLSRQPDLNARVLLQLLRIRRSPDSLAAHAHTLDVGVAGGMISIADAAGAHRHRKDLVHELTRQYTSRKKKAGSAGPCRS
jgi:hypothetical protein